MSIPTALVIFDQVSGQCSVYHKNILKKEFKDLEKKQGSVLKESEYKSWKPAGEENLFSKGWTPERWLHFKQEDLKDDGFFVSGSEEEDDLVIEEDDNSQDEYYYVGGSEEEEVEEDDGEGEEEEEDGDSEEEEGDGDSEEEDSEEY